MLEQRRISIVIPVYRDARRAIGLAQTLQDQQLPTGAEAQIILVDDGSDDGTYEQLHASLANRADVAIVRLGLNAGRSGARNAGAARASGDVLFFIDCDCLPVDKGLLVGHLQVMNPQVVATVGPVTGNEDGFWHRYQTEASLRRAQWHADGFPYGGSSQNMMVRRLAFTACGGFDENFRTYGFEDRDLLLRLASYGSIAWADLAWVRHTDELDMVSVSRKMKEAGGRAAQVFSARHPKVYRQLGYAALDAREHWWLKPAAVFADLMLNWLAHATDFVVTGRIWPYAVKRSLVKLVTALSYLAGTRRGP